jgi:lipopolysaccharide export system protein LptA
MRPLRLLSIGLLLLAGTRVSAAAQAVDCRVIEVPGSDLQAMNVGLPTETQVLTLAVLDCDGGRRIRADQAIVIRASQRIQLFGNVQITDPDRTLTADQATFFSATRQLDALNNAMVRDHNTGSWLRGDRILYLQETAERPARIEATATSGLARAVLFPDTTAAARPAPAPAVADTAGDPAAAAPVPPPAPAAADSTVVDATQITIIGQQSFRALGSAVMTRDSLRATGQTIEYTEETGELLVTRNARVELPRQELVGDSISATVDEGQRLREVLARHGAALTSEEMSVTAAAVRLFFDDEGGVNRLVAMDWPASASVAGSARARVEAEEFIMESDSIDVLAPGQQITEAVAIGNAYGERLTPDSLRALLPDVEPEQLALIESDWMRGDTVRAFFGPAPTPQAVGPDVAAPDPAAPDPVAVDPETPGSAERVMERLLASGAPALSVYRMRDEEDPEAKLSVNYLSAERIEVAFAGGTVSVVTADGNARGIYLQPAPPPGQR